MGVSSAPAVKAAFKARLVANATIIADGIQVSRGNPYPDNADPKLIIIGKATATTEPESIGGTDREETYELEVIVSVEDDAGTPYETLETEAYRIAGIVEASLAAWQATGWGDVINGWILPSGTRDAEAFTFDQQTGQALRRECSVTLTLSVLAAI